MKIHFITYGDKKFDNTLIRLKREAINSNFFDTITIYRPNDIEFQTKFKEVLSLKRGGGYYIWKPQIIIQKMREIEENDIIVYLDAGSSINKLGYKKFREYIDLISESEYGFLTFPCNKGKTYLTDKLLNSIEYLFNHVIDDDIQNYIAGHFIIKKNNNSKKILESFIQLLEFDKFLITDKYNKETKNKDFKGDSRHDQSIFSILFNIYGCINTNDPHYFGDRDNAFTNDNYKLYPFLATRYRHIKLPNKEIKINRKLLIFIKSKQKT